MPDEGDFPAGPEDRARRKRAYELHAAVGIAVFVLSCSWLQLTHGGTDSWTFVVLFDINLILMLVAFLLVARNVFKLMMDRRRRIFGSTLRVRLVLIFLILTLLPTGVLFLASNRVITTGMDTVFTIRLLGEAADVAAIDEVKVSMRLILAVLSAFMLCSSVWYGLRLSNELIAPLLALSQGTERIARGELDLILEEHGSDEISQLVGSFNRMAADLRGSRAKLTAANELLALHNAAMDERRRYIEAVLDNIGTGVITLDGQGRLQTINKAACSTFHVTPAFLYGRTPETLLPAAYAPAFLDMLSSLRARPDRPWRHRTDFVARGRTWKLAVNAMALTDGDGEARTFVVVIDDVTDMERMQRMAAWREVARRIAHEIKNPLTPIKLSAQRLERRFGPGIADPVFRQCTGLIINQTERLQAMASEFSAFSTLPQIHLRPARLEPIMDELSATFSSSHPDIGWRCERPPELPWLMLDPDALLRALLNLLINAADAVRDARPPEGMLVSLTAGAGEEPGSVRVAVADNGPGLTPEERDRMFEPYFSRKPGGTGLGLAIVKSVVADHHGTVAADSDGHGTTVAIVLPACADVGAPDRRDAPSNPASSRQPTL